MNPQDRLRRKRAAFVALALTAALGAVALELFGLTEIVFISLVALAALGALWAYVDGRRLRVLCRTGNDLPAQLPALFRLENEEGDCLCLNSQWASFTGMPLEKLRQGNWWDQIHPDDRKGWTQSETPDQPWYRQYRLRHHDSKYHVVLEIAQTVRSKDATNTACIAFDISPLRELHEAELLALRQQLQRTDEKAVIGHLTGNIVHDFNSVLTTIFGYAELARMSPVVERNPLLGVYLNEIVQAGSRARKLTSQLLALDQNKVVVYEQCDPGNVIERTLKSLRPSTLTNINVSTAIAPRLPPIGIAADQLQKAISDLLIYTRDATFGHGNIAISAALITLGQQHHCNACQLGFSGEYVMISISDGSSKLTPESIAALFSPFYGKTESSNGDLGLAIPAGIIHAARGHLEVAPNLDQGNVFRLYFPVCKTDFYPGAPARAPAFAIGPDGKVAAWWQSLTQALHR